MANPADQTSNSGQPAAPKQSGKMTHLGKYRLIKKLGQGGMGEVYLAEDTKLDAMVQRTGLGHIRHDQSGDLAGSDLRWHLRSLALPATTVGRHGEHAQWEMTVKQLAEVGVNLHGCVFNAKSQRRKGRKENVKGGRTRIRVHDKLRTPLASFASWRLCVENASTQQRREATNLHETGCEIDKRGN